MRATRKELREAQNCLIPAADVSVGGWAIDISHQIAALLERLPVAVALFDASGIALGKAGHLSGLLGAVMPSRDEEQASRWKFLDRGGAIIPPTHWPSECALRGEINHAGMIGSYRDSGEHRIRVISIPTLNPSSSVATVAFLQRLDNPSRSADGSHADLEQKFIDTLVKSVRAA